MKATKHFFNRLFLLTCLLFGLLAISVSAATTYTSHDGLYKFTLANGRATITAYTGGSTNLTIPATVGPTKTKQYPVIGIGDGYQTIISTVAITDVETIDFEAGSKVTTIHASAFEGCLAMNDISLPATLKIIDANAFKDCSKLTYIILPKNLTTIGENAFLGCSSLCCVESSTAPYPTPASNSWGISYFDNDLPAKLTYLGAHAFQGAPLTGSLYVPGSLTSVSAYTFYKCKELTDIFIANGVTNIEQNAFASCSSTERIYVPKSVRYIEAGAFSKSIIDGQTKVTLFEDSAMDDYMTGFYPKFFHYIDGINENHIVGPIKFTPAIDPAVDPAMKTLWVGQPVSVKLTYGLANPKADCTDVITWKSYNPALSIENATQTSATLTGYIAGNGYMVKVTAKGGTESKEYVFNVKAAPTKITVTEKDKTASASRHTFDVGSAVAKTIQLKAVSSPAKGAPITWTSSDKAVATVDKTTGEVTINGAQHIGTTTITAKSYNGIVGTYKITTTIKRSALKDWTEKFKAVKVGETFAFSYPKMSDKTVLSSNSAIAAIVSGKKVKAKAPGLTSIKVFNAKNMGTCDVLVYPKKQTITNSSINGKKISLKWEKQANVSGYSVEYRLSTDSTYKAIQKDRSQSQNTYTFSTLSANKLYYFRVRSYITYKNKRYYGPYSAVLKLKTQS